MNGWNAVAVIKHAEDYLKPVHLNKIHVPHPTYDTKHSQMQVVLHAYGRCWHGKGARYHGAKD